MLSTNESKRSIGASILSKIVEKMATTIAMHTILVVTFLDALYGHHDFFLVNEKDFDSKKAYTLYGAKDLNAKTPSEHEDGDDSNVHEVVPTKS